MIPTTAPEDMGEEDMDEREDDERPNFCMLVWEGTEIRHTFRSFEDKLFRTEVRGYGADIHQNLEAWPPFQTAYAFPASCSPHIPQTEAREWLEKRGAAHFWDRTIEHLVLNQDD
jgi:hypothetical protein